MSEPLPSNLHPVNQAAKQWLRRAKVPPEPHSLYAYQLLQWGLAQDPLGPPLHSAVQEQVDVLQHQWRPEKALAFLLRGLDDQPEYDDLLSADDLRQAENPLEASWQLLGVLLDQMVSQVEGFPPKSLRQ